MHEAEIDDITCKQNFRPKHRGHNKFVRKCLEKKICDVFEGYFQITMLVARIVKGETGKNCDIDLNFRRFSHYFAFIT